MLYEDLGGGISNYTEQYNFNEEEEKDVNIEF